jgi:hypothetical protein
MGMVSTGAGVVSELLTCGIPMQNPIKALTAFFERWNESHCIVITAPTSTAATLVGGSTYQFLGINDKNAK